MQNYYHRQAIEAPNINVIVAAAVTRVEIEVEEKSLRLLIASPSVKGRNAIYRFIERGA